MSPFSTLGVFMKSEDDTMFFIDTGSTVVKAIELPEFSMPSAGASHKAMDGAVRVKHKGELRIDIAAVPGAELLRKLREQTQAGMYITVAVAILADRFVDGKHQKHVAEIYELRSTSVLAFKPQKTQQNDQVVYTLIASVGSVLHIAFDPTNYPSVENFK